MRSAVRHLKGCSDPVMRSIVERVGPCRMTFIEPTFQSLVRSIVFQQLSGHVARVIFERLERAAKRITPKSILALTPEEMKACGLSTQKLTYIRDLAAKTAAGEVVFRKLLKMTDAEVIEHLTQVKGVGEWTAHMFLMFALERPDVLAVGDLGIKSAIKKAYGLDELPKPAEVERIAAPWRPYATVACWYLWRSLEGPAAV